MANMNEAYDLGLFEPREPRLVELKGNKKLAKEKQKHHHRQSVINVVVYLLIAVVVMGLVGYLITCNVRLTEMNQTIAECEKELGVLQSEKVRLETELAGKTSAERINEYALENGMLPMDSNQIYYITAQAPDEVHVASGGGSWPEQLWRKIKAILS